MTTLILLLNKNYNNFKLIIADCLTWNATIAIWNTSVPDQVSATKYRSHFSLRSQLNTNLTLL